jgi:hypothetical protein
MAAMEWVRKHSTAIVLSLLMAFFIPMGCAEVSSELKGTAKPEGGITESVPASKTYVVSHEKLWQATRNVLDEWGYIYEANPSSNTIKTEPKHLSDTQKFRFIGSDYTAKLHITVEGSTVALRARFSKKSNIVMGGENLEFPEKENELRKNFYEALNAKIGSSVTQIDKKQGSEIKDQPAQRGDKAQLQGEAKEADPSPSTMATVRKAKKEQRLDGYIFQDKNSKKFFLEDSDGNTYKFTGGQWIKMK